jgi:hypothetical protein
VLRRLLLLPLLAPLLAALVVAAINPRPAIALRLLIWRSPALPMGAWIALAAAGGAAMSASASGLALRQGATTPLRRRVRSEAREAWSPAEVWPQAERREAAQAEAPPRWSSAAAAPPPRAPGEPAPTVEVPFRVIRRAAAEPAPAPAAAERAAARSAGSPASAQPVPVALEDWGGEISEDW